MRTMLRAHECVCVRVIFQVHGHVIINPSQHCYVCWTNSGSAADKNGVFRRLKF